MLWKGFQRPKRLEFERETLTDRFGRFHAQPVERGFSPALAATGPQPYTDLRREVGGRNLQVWRPGLPARWRKDRLT